MITVYTKPGCMPCKMTCHKLMQMGVPHKLTDVTLNDDDMAVVIGLGYREMPVVVNGDDHWSGFRPDKLAALGGGE